MDSPPPKRRKTSPLTHLSITPQDRHTRLESQDGERISQGRASFMSPTKASLARFNPSLLAPSNASDPERPQSQGSDRERSKIRGDLNGLTSQITQADVAEPASTAERTTGAPFLSTNGQGLHAAPRRRSRTPGKQSTPSNNTQLLPLSNARESLPAEERGQRNRGHATDPERQSPFPLPPLTRSDVTGTNGGPAANEGTHLPSTPTHSGIPGQKSGMGLSEDGEPSLPSTPVHLGLEAPAERPKGLLFSSPNRRSKRKETTATKSSPLKPKDAGPSHSLKTSDSVLRSLGPRVYISSVPRPPPTEQQAAQLKLRESLQAMEQQLHDIEDELMKQTLVLKWYQQDGKETKEISKLKKDVLTRSAKISRFFDEIGFTGMPETTDRGSQNDTVDIPSLHQVSRSTDISPARTSLTSRLAHFLPFGRSPLPPARTPSIANRDAARYGSKEIPESAAALFNVTLSRINLLPPTSGPANSYCRNLVLTSPMQLLQAKLQVTMDGADLMVTGLNILEISQWAHQELGTWFALLNGNKNLLAVGAAFGHYYVVSKERAECFRDSEQEFQAVLDSQTAATSINQHNLSPYLGRPTLTLSREPVTLEFSWLVSINDEGEVESLISAKANFPPSWEQTQGGDQLAKVGEAFDILVKDRGPKEAIRVVCKLIFPS